MTFYHGVHAFFEATEGSLKWYTDFPPVLDRFKKTFLHGISGRLKYFLAWLSWFFFCFQESWMVDAYSFRYSSFHWIRFQTKQERVLFVRIRLS